MKKWNEMDAKERRTAIAKLCGWKRIHPVMLFTGQAPGTDPKKISKVPDYLNDLNAMYEAEEKIPGHWWMVFESHLTKASGTKTMLWHTTAFQRAEAFYLTMTEVA